MPAEDWHDIFTGALEVDLMKFWDNEFPHHITAAFSFEFSGFQSSDKGFAAHISILAY